MSQQHLPIITPRHQMIEGNPFIGLQYYQNSQIDALVKTLDGVRWSDELRMNCIPKNSETVQILFKTFRNIAWVDLRHLDTNRPVRKNALPEDYTSIRLTNQKYGDRKVPEEFIELLERKRYSINTARNYVSQFAAFMEYFKNTPLVSIQELQIREYLNHRISQGISTSTQNVICNAIKYYYEQVQQMPGRYYDLERPRKREKLPTVFSKEEVEAIINSIENLKHKAIITTIYSAGLRISEVINLKLIDIDSDRMVIVVRGSKGNKDRNTLLDPGCLVLLRRYWQSYVPKEYLFEGQDGFQYSKTSIQHIFKRALQEAKIKKRGTVHTLRHSFATHLVDDGIDIRVIQTLLGHNSLTTTEIYSHISNASLRRVSSPLSRLRIDFSD